jgi:chemotaxis-related protein WspD
VKLPVVAGPAVEDCWNIVGVHGDRSCPELPRVVHCHNCEVFARAGRRFLDAPSPPGYLEEWTDRLAGEVEEAASELTSVLIFRLSEEWLALPVSVLVEVTAPCVVHRVPHRAGLLAGLVNIRGELHLCAHLDGLLGIGRSVSGAAPRPRGGSAGARLLVARREAERWVFPVEEVDQVHRLAARELREVPPTLGRAVGRVARGVFPWGERTVGLLDEGRVFAALRARVR